MRYIITWIIHRVTKVLSLLVLAFIVKINRLILFFCLIYLDGFWVCFPILYFYLLYRLVTCPYKTLKKVYTISIINIYTSLDLCWRELIYYFCLLFNPDSLAQQIYLYVKFFIKIFIYLTVYLRKKF